MNIRNHLLEHIFIIATSIAMVVHTTWTFGTLFAGPQPVVYPGDISTIVAYIFWVTPALLVAIAIDVGQIQTSLKLAKSKRLGQKIALGITFLALALAGFYLQWFHLAHHIPDIEFGAGLTPETAASLQGLKELAILIIPALLPLSTVLYTLSLQSDQVEDIIEDVKIDIDVPDSDPTEDLPQLEDVNIEEDVDQMGLLPLLDIFEDETAPYEPFDEPNAHHELICPDCGWSTGPKLRLESAERSLRTHQARHCDAHVVEVE